MLTGNIMLSFNNNKIPAEGPSLLVKMTVLSVELPEWMVEGGRGVGWLNSNPADY